MISRRRVIALSAAQRSARQRSAGADLRLAKPVCAPRRAFSARWRHRCHRARRRWQAVGDLGQQVVVENRGGGATNIGTEAVSRAEPDGYTMLLHSMPLAVNKFLFASLPYDPVVDLAPVSLLCDYPNIMAVPNNSPHIRSMSSSRTRRPTEARSRLASSGHGTSVHLSGELFKRMAGIEMLHVPYRGGGPALNDLIPGRVDVMLSLSMQVPRRDRGTCSISMRPCA